MVIRAGRTALNAAEIAEQIYHSKSDHQRKHGTFKPDSDFPAPVTSSTSRNRLWDSEQAFAYANGDPIPELPTEDHPDDLLDRVEAAALAGVKNPSVWDTYTNTLYAEQLTPDAIVGGVKHWRRSRLQDWMANRPGRGRPKGVTLDKPRAANKSTQQRLAALRELVAEAESAGRELDVDKAAAALDVSTRTIERYLHQLNDQSDQ